MKRRTMMDIGPYFSTDAGARPLGQGADLPFPWSLPSLLSGGGIPGLPSLGLPTGLGVDFGLLTQGVPELTLFTPWSEQISDFQYNEIRQPPEFNVAAYEYGDLAARFAALGMGPPGFVAIVSEKSIGLSTAEAMYQGTPYKLFSGQGVYEQQDPAAVPQIHFIYWGQLRDPGDALGGNGDVQLAADSIAGQGKGLVIWGIELPASSSSVRPVPTTDFASAFQAQFGGGTPSPKSMTPGGGGDAVTPVPGGGGQPATTTTPTTATTSTAKKASMGKPIAIAAGVALGTFLVVREINKTTSPRRRRSANR